VHLKSLLRKIRVDNRTQAAIWALSNLPEPRATGFI
jgi:DNA-binding CsgD family transcriptional regulator